MAGVNGLSPSMSVQRFGRLPVEVVVELARIRMTAGDIANLDVHDVIPLAQVMDQPVVLSVHGRAFAAGDLELVENSLSVRVTSLADAGADSLRNGEE